jgi:hypothetical protein
MANEVTADGLTTDTQAELVTAFTTAFEAIYGADIDLTQSSPDGQMMMIFIQVILDVLALITTVYNGFDPDNAIGRVLDQRVAINGIQRQAGTYTVTNITVVVSEALTLTGIDDDPVNPYTLQDNAGTQWQLQETQTPVGSGTYVYAFQAAVPGATLTIPNTITIPVTIVLGVTSVNNPTTYSTLGVNEESDAELKIRRARSVSLASQGYLAGLLAALENINGMASAFVYENNSGTTDGDGVPGHSIWVITSGTATDAEIAEAIYAKRNAGCGMFGSEVYVIDQVDGSEFPVYWDEVTSENLYVKFTATSLDGINPPNIAAILTGLVTSFAPGVNEQVNVNELSTLVQAIDPNTLVTLAGFSLSAGGVYTNTLSPSTKAKQFAVSAARIIIIPIILSPVTVTVGATEDQQFTPYGGIAAYTYTIPVNNSGASIDAAGLYTAGATPGTDTVRVTDSLGNTGDATVTVV